MKFVQNLLAEMKKNSAARKGMTLIEIMIVVTLMVAIMGMVGFNLINSADSANEGLAKTQLKNFKQNCTAYKMQNSQKWPEKLEDLASGKRPIIDEVPNDPWGNPYIFVKNGNKITISSAGADGIPNNEDDIVEVVSK